MSWIARSSARIAVGALAALALTSLAISPVGAHSGQLFTVTTGLEEEPQHYATISASTAALGPFAPEVSDTHLAWGLEIYDETGYVLLGRPFAEAPAEMSLGVWDHTTGATLSQIPLVPADPAVTIFDMWALDTTTDGRILAFADVEILEGEFPLDYVFVVEIDPVTGEVSLVVQLTPMPAEGEVFFDAIATDPTTGATYIFFDMAVLGSRLSALDLDGGTYSDPVPTTGISDSLAGAYMSGADFDSAGALWFYWIGEGGAQLASTVGAFSASAPAVSSGTVTFGEVEFINLAYDPYAAPQLADTGWDAAPVALGGALVLLLGAGAVLVARRRTA